MSATGMDLEFYRAAVKGDADAFKRDKEIDSILTPQKNTILHIYLTGDNNNISEAFVQEILLMCPSLLTKANAKGETLLHMASRYGHSKVVKKLIQIAKENLEVEGEIKRFIRAINDKKDTALHEAVYFHHNIEVVDILTKEDPELSNFVNSGGETPLYLAAERAYGDMVEKILENCKSPKQDGPNGRTALHASILHNLNQEVVSKLLRSSASGGKERDENGWIPLHFASLHVSPSLTEMLLRFDRKMAYMRDKRGMTPLHFAARCGSINAVRKILEYCPDCSELVDNNGYNALHHTAISNKETLSAWTSYYILTNKSLSNLTNEKDNNGDTPLHLLAKKGSLYEALHYLFNTSLQRVVDTMAFNKHNQTPFDAANHHLGPDSPLNEVRSYVLKKMKKIGARHGGRIMINNEDDDRKKKEEKGNDESSDSGIMEKERETIFLVATLIATVTFTAAFTLPGGTIQELDQPHKGSPILNHNSSFKAFVITDSISFVLSASAVFLLICSSFSTFTFMQSNLVSKTETLTMMSMFFMIIAFVTGTYAVLSASKPLGLATLLIGSSFFLTFFLILFWVAVSSALQKEKIYFRKGIVAISNAEEMMKLV